MISKLTTIGTVATLRAWQRKHKVSDKALEELLSRLSGVLGNKSFTDSLAALYDEFQEASGLDPIELKDHYVALAIKSRNACPKKCPCGGAFARGDAGPWLR